jgi:mannose-6-phosphate isomerase-like protein (cupin superfamily)
MLKENIVEKAQTNEDFRRVLITGEDNQVVVMSLEADQDVGMEVHEDLDQIVVCIEGHGEVIIDGERDEFGPQDLVFVPQGTRHNLTNTGDTEMKLYTIYSPPEHDPGTIHQTKAEALADEENEEGETGEEPLESGSLADEEEDTL